MDFSVLCYISWVILQSTETNSGQFSKKGSEWKDKAIHRKAKIPTQSKARNQENVRTLGRKNRGKAPGLHSQDGVWILQNGPSRDGELNWKPTRSLLPHIESRGFLSTYYVTNTTREISDQFPKQMGRSQDEARYFTHLSSCAMS